MRKSEKISDAIGRIDEDIVAEADGKRASSPQKGGGRFLVPALSAAACAAVICGAAVLANRGDDGISADTENVPPISETSIAEMSTVGENAAETSVYAETLAEAEYPVMAPYPNEDDCFDENGVWQDELAALYYYPWEEQSTERRKSGELLYDSLTGFARSSSYEVLAGSEGENRVYSPGSAYMALAMLAEISDGGSRAQILELFGTDTIESLREHTENFWKATYRNDGATTSVLANSLWLSKDADFDRETLNRLAESCYASSYSGDTSSEEMTAALRDWLNKQTGGLLGDAVNGVRLEPETVISLCSTVYFRAKWDLHFLAENNTVDTFHSPNGDIETEFMNDTDEYGSYYWGEDYGAVRLGFANGGAMWLILPDEDKTVDGVLASGEYMDMLKTGFGWEKSKIITVHNSVPKFDVSSETDLKDVLERMGVTDVFNSAVSDFTPLLGEAGADGIYVSGAKHAARVQIDEEGCTAAAFTQIAAAGAALPPEDEIYFVLDRPFIFAVMSDTNQPLFIGTVYTP
ncbi:MAG: hypothetical protein NC395_02545 [Prevotella sp.]|nr:hypothetical protein [Prevotella sp.]